jgi:hypothetical protein
MKNIKKFYLKHRKLLRFIIRYIALFILFYLAFIGIFRVFYLNTECEGFNSYYAVEDMYAERSGFLNLKTTFNELPNKNIECNSYIFGLKIPILKSSNLYNQNDYNLSFD